MIAPSEFSIIGLDASRFIKCSGKEEYHGPCPRCGGKDRFIVHTSREYPHWFMWCRPGVGHCGWSGWADEFNKSLATISEDERKAWAETRRKAEDDSKKLRHEKLAEFTISELWIELSRRMSITNRQWWEKQGIPDSVQNAYFLGYNPSFYGGAYSIPYFDNSYAPVNMQYRLERPPAVGDKYRWAGLGYSSHFICYPGSEFDSVVICEGAKKAIVFSHHIAKGRMQVIASPSKNDFEKSGIIQSSKNYRHVFIMLDPDALKQAQELSRKIGTTSRIVNLPTKADDMILQGYGAEYFRAMFANARRA